MHLLIDGNNLLHRAFWISQNFNKLTNADGKDVGCIFTLLRSVKSYVEKFKVDNDVYIIWDKRLLWPSTNFREQSTDVEYKGDRNKEDNQKIFAQVDETEQVLKMLGVRNMFPRRMEADDVVSWLSTKLEGSVTIVSADADLYQLVSKTVQTYNPIKKMLVTEDNFEEKIGMPKADFLLYKAIRGDDSDNIKGLHGYGPVKTRKLIATLKNGPQELTEEQMHLVSHNLMLVDLAKGYLVHEGEVELYEEQFNNLQNVKPDLNKFKEFCVSNNFTSFLNNFVDWESTFCIGGPKIKQMRIK